MNTKYSNMRLLIIISLLFSFSSSIKSTALNTKVTPNDLEGFKHFLGLEKSKVDDLLIAAFDQFLIDNFPNEKNQHLRIVKVLECIIYNNGCNLNKKPNPQLVSELNKSGLRQEMWLYANKDYDKYKPKNSVEDLFNFDEVEEPIEQQGALILPEDIQLELPIAAATNLLNNNSDKETTNEIRINYSGDYFYGLIFFSPNDTNIQHYAKAIVKTGDISPVQFLPVFLKKVNNFNEPFIKRVIILALFLLAD